MSRVGVRWVTGGRIGGRLGRWAEGKESEREEGRWEGREEGRVGGRERKEGNGRKGTKVGRMTGRMDGRAVSPNSPYLCMIYSAARSHGARIYKVFLDIINFCLVPIIRFLYLLVTRI